MLTMYLMLEMLNLESISVVSHIVNYHDMIHTNTIYCSISSWSYLYGVFLGMKLQQRVHIIIVSPPIRPLGQLTLHLSEA